MARRSPMNNRYQKGTTPKGVARKSAARAKPKRAAGESAKSGPAKKKQPKKKNSFLREMPTSAEYKHLRKTWWNCIAASFILVILSLILTSFPQVYSAIRLSTDQAQQVGLAMTALALVFMVATWYIDLRKIRPMVRAFEAEKAAGKKDKKESAETKDADDKKSDDKSKDDKKSDDDKKSKDSKKSNKDKKSNNKKSDKDKEDN